MATLPLLQSHIAEIADRATALDESADFPGADLAMLAQLGLPMAPVPRALGGEGAGTEPEGADMIFELLRLLGHGNMSVGRLFEAHVNVVRLVIRFGTNNQITELIAACQAGELFGLWVTDAPNSPVRLDAGALSGAKGPCSGAGHLRRALITVTDGAATRMALIHLHGGEPMQSLGPRLHGMRASANGTIHLDGFALPRAALLGSAGDYLREPDFSTGAWRTMAVTLGGLDALIAAVRAQLCIRGHDAASLQQARFGKMLIAQETARLWTRQAAHVAEGGTLPVADQVAYVNLARIAVESASLEAMRHAQRALGLSALLRPHPVERVLRDLTTYLRQPAPDAVLTEAGLHGLRA